jgi:hypothetical protein
VTLGSVAVAQLMTYSGGRVITIVNSLHELGSNKLIEQTSMLESIKTGLVRKKKKKRRKQKDKDDFGDGNPEVDSEFNIQFNVSFKAINVSLCYEYPVRREVMSLSLDDLELMYKIEQEKSGLVLKIDDLQVDNYTENTFSPVLMRPKKKKEKYPFLHLKMVKSSIHGATPYFEYLSILILPFEIFIDAPTLLIFLADFHTELAKVATVNNVLCSRDPTEWSDQNTIIHIDPAYRSCNSLVDIFALKAHKNSTKFYFNVLEIHPIIASVTFRPYEWPRNQKSFPKGYPGIDILTKPFLNVSDMDIKLSSFLANAVLLQPSALGTRYVAKAREDIKGQMLAIVGSYLSNINLLGRPAGLARNVGGGIHALFYEPAAGIMESPGGFALGIVKGTKGLVQGVVGGVISSGFTVVGTATGGIAAGAAAISGDEGGAARLRNRENTTGILSGLTSGAASIGMGVFNGVTGIVTKPLEQSRQGGALGFMKGLGQGIIGAVASPIIGVTEGVSTIAHGVTSQIEGKEALKPRHPPRAYMQSYSADKALILVPYDMKTAKAQASMAATSEADKSSKEQFMTLIPLMDDTNYLILTTKRFIVNLAGIKEEMRKPWRTLSHVQLKQKPSHSVVSTGEQLTLELVVFGDLGKIQTLPLPCGSRQRAFDVYCELYLRARPFCANPSAFLDPKDAFDVYDDDTGSQQLITTTSENALVATKPRPSISANDAYIFGTINRSESITAVKMPSTNEFKKESRIYFEEGIANYADLDKKMWQTVINWKGRTLFTQKCVITAVINKSSIPIQISDVTLKEGREYVIWSVSRYDEESRTIHPHGICVIFGYADTQGLLSKGHVTLSVQSPVFTAKLTTRGSQTDVTSNPPLNANLVEKSISSVLAWNKNVIIVCDV